MSEIRIDAPRVIIFENPDGTVQTVMHPRTDDNVVIYAMLVADLARHVARMFQTSEDTVWAFVEAERDNPTTDLAGGFRRR